MMTSDAAKHLSEAVIFRTISHDDDTLTDYSEYRAFLEFLEKTYKNVHRYTKRVMISEFSPVYHLEAKTKKYPPILLLGHYDVVPVEESTIKDWAVPPFSGEIREDYIYGRGTLDDKNQIISIMEAMEEILEEGYVGERDIYIAFGFDEEIGGMNGAKQIAAYFRERGITFDLVLDEGGAVVEGVVEGLETPVALVGVAEKGSSMIRVKAKGDGGHSSMPGRTSAITVLSEAVLRLSENPMKPRLTAPVTEMLRGMAPYMGRKGIFLKSIDRSFPYLSRVLSKSTTMNSLIRTTIAATMMNAGTAPNVMPQEASVTFSARILPGDTYEDVIAHMKKVNGHLPLEYETLVKEEASAVSPHDSAAFRNLKKNIMKVFPGVMVLPYLMAGGTDARKYEGLSENILRFSCIRMNNEDLDRIHSTDERIHMDNLRVMIEFYKVMIKG